MSKVSDGRSVPVGLVGPKPRLRSVGDGQQVNIPVPAWGVQQGRAGKGEPLNGLRWQAGNTREAGATAQKSLDLAPRKTGWR